MIKRIQKTVLLWCLLGCGILSAQTLDPRLANQYYDDGEYEKAAVLFEQLYKANPSVSTYLMRYVECLQVMDKEADAENLLKKEVKSNPENYEAAMLLSDIYEKKGQQEEAKKIYNQLISKLKPDQNQIIRIASTFINRQKYDWGIKAYEAGEQLLKEKGIFSSYLAELYRRNGDTPKMISAYLDMLINNPNMLNYVKTLLSRGMNDKEYKELQAQLYARIQQYPEADYFPDLLSWAFLQRKDYKNALRQIRALDRQFNENGGRVFALARMAYEDKDYDTALQAYEYVVNEKGRSTALYIEAKRAALMVKRTMLTKDFEYTPEQLKALAAEYESFIDELGKSRETAGLILELADLEAYYINDLPKAVATLQELINIPGIDRNVRADAKLSLADIYVIQGEMWESTLLYSQVDKEFKEEAKGEEARFRNARLSYFKGDFQWAQAQFDILKSSTSKLIANDAIDLSVFIMENTGLDSTEAPMKMYAEAELLAFQHKYDEAFKKLDSIKVGYPKHTLQDDMLFLEGNLYVKLKDYAKAAEKYQFVVDSFGQDIRADNALFALAGLYENQLNDKEKAKSLYEKLFMEYSSSVYAVEARKKYRQLRGDEVVQ